MMRMPAFVTSALGAAMMMATPALALDVTLGGRMEQAGLVTGTAPPGSKIAFAGHAVPVTVDGKFLLGIDRDAPAKVDLVITGPDGTRDVRHLTVAKRDWIIDRVDGVPQQLVTPDPELAAKIALENGYWAVARKKLELTPFFETGFIRPAEGRISGVFGGQRILNGSPRAPHTGLDIAAPTGTPVHAAADGVVSMEKEMLIMTGDTVMINHGYGLQTFYIHMSKLYVTEGQKVKQGDIIGEIGMTGRATGPHLHFGATWFDQRLDPETVLAVLPVAQTNAEIPIQLFANGTVSIGGKTVANAMVAAELQRLASRTPKPALTIAGVEAGTNVAATAGIITEAKKLGLAIVTGPDPEAH